VLQCHKLRQRCAFFSFQGLFCRCYNNNYHKFLHVLPTQPSSRTFWLMALFVNSVTRQHAGPTYKTKPFPIIWHAHIHPCKHTSAHARSHVRQRRCTCCAHMLPSNLLSVGMQPHDGWCCLISKKHHFLYLRGWEQASSWVTLRLSSIIAAKLGKHLLAFFKQVP